MLPIVLFALLLAFSPNTSHAKLGDCPQPFSLGPTPSRLLVIVPGTTQNHSNWQSFITALKNDDRSKDTAVLFYEHGIIHTTIGSAYSYARELDACIQEKIDHQKFTKITLVGHSVGGMLARRAYLEAASRFENEPNTWPTLVDRILLFASVNRGIPDNATWWSPTVNWILRAFPHPHFVLEDMIWGSDFIADTRIAWIRFFGQWSAGSTSQPTPTPPKVFQYWGTVDSIVKKSDNADLEAFSGQILIDVPEAEHGNLQRLESEYTSDASARWSLFSERLLAPLEPPIVVRYKPRKFLFILRGIRDSTSSEWVQKLSDLAKKPYQGNVVAPEYGYFSAAQFAIRPIRAKNIPSFRDLYAQKLAENPATEFDVIAHSNGTYILGHSMESTPSMKFSNIAMAAPVLPINFPWGKIIDRKQVNLVRYDASSLDWPVGILCPALRALGFDDIGPAGLVKFGSPEAPVPDSVIKMVGWHDGGHGQALTVAPNLNEGNLFHLLRFAYAGDDFTTSNKTLPEPGFLAAFSRMTPYALWIFILLATAPIFRLLLHRKWSLPKFAIVALSATTLTYIVLDSV